MASRKLEHAVSLSPTEIASIKHVIEGSSLTEVHIEQNGEHIVIGGAALAQTSEHQRAVTVTAPAAGTIYLGTTSAGQRVTVGDQLGQLHILKTIMPVIASTSGRVAAIFVDDGELAAYGADLFLIQPEETQ